MQGMSIAPKPRRATVDCKHAAAAVRPYGSPRAAASQAPLGRPRACAGGAAGLLQQTVSCSWLAAAAWSHAASSITGPRFALRGARVAEGLDAPARGLCGRLLRCARLQGRPGPAGCGRTRCRALPPGALGAFAARAVAACAAAVLRGPCERARLQPRRAPGPRARVQHRDRAKENIAVRVACARGAARSIGRQCVARRSGRGAMGVGTSAPMRVSAIILRPAQKGPNTNHTPVLLHGRGKRTPGGRAAAKDEQVAVAGQRCSPNPSPTLS